jgi:hypothetical protein
VLARHAPPISRSCANLDMFSSAQSTRRRGVSKSLGEQLGIKHPRRKSPRSTYWRGSYAPSFGHVAALR